MRIVYFGSGAFGLPTLQTLATHHRITGVVTQPDRPAGRDRRLTPTPIGAWAQEHLPLVPIFRPEKVSVPEVVEAIRALEADAWVVIAFGQKLPKALLADRFAVNLHASLLPRWRGAAPINAAVLAGDPVTGNSVITLADRMDAGLVLGTSTRRIEPLATAGELHDLLAGDGPDLVERVLRQHESGTLRPEPQDESLVTIATKLSKDDGTPDFHQPADFVRRQIHALTPWPGVTAELRSDGTDDAKAKPLTIKLLRARLADPSWGKDGDAPVEAGTIVDATHGIVACGKGTRLQLIDVQPAGKRAMAWGDFARGRTLGAKSMLGPVDDGDGV